MSEALTASGLDPAVRARANRFALAVDRLAPGRLEGLYLYGSATLGDFRPGQSDLDLAAVAGEAWPQSGFPLLAALHAELAEEGEASVDVVYVTWAELAQDPARANAPFALEGRFGERGAFDANWAVSESLGRYGIALRGAAHPPVARDAAALRRFCRENLRTYWLGLAQRALAREAGGQEDIDGEALVWRAAGVLRLAYTIATGDITSKSNALRWGLGQAAYQPWRPLLASALALREGPGAAKDMGLRPAAGLGVFMRAVIEGAATP